MLRTLNLVLIGLLVAGAGWTFIVKHNAEEAHERVDGLERQIANEREEIDLLRADWALLSSPTRLEQLVARYNDELGLKNLDATQLVGFDQLPAMKQIISIPVQDGSDMREANNDPNSKVSTDRIFTGSIVKGRPVDGVAVKGDRVVPANRQKSVKGGGSR